MRFLFIAWFFSVSTLATAQSKMEHLSYNKLIEIKGTEYIVATAQTWNKLGGAGEHLLFINTHNGENHLADIPKGSNIQNVEQVKMDSLDINMLIVGAKTVDLDGKSGIDWDDPRQILVFSPDGKKKVQVTDNSFFASDWAANHSTGRLVITGRHDTNGNRKLDKHDENRIIIYDLVKMEVISKF